MSTEPTVQKRTFPDWQSAIDHAWKMVKARKLSMAEFREIVTAAAASREAKR